MIKYFKVFIDKTSKNRGNNKEGYSIFDRETETFKTVREVKKWLKERYSGNKRVKLYRDDKNGESYQAGWIYCFKNGCFDRNEGEVNWYQQDWVEVREVKEKMVLLRR